MSEAIKGDRPFPTFDRAALVFCQELCRSPNIPTEVQLAAARFAIQFERPALAAVAEVKANALTLEQLVQRAILPAPAMSVTESEPAAPPLRLVDE